MNVGTHSPDDFSEQHNISDLLESIVALDKNFKIRNISAKKIKFGYRQSNLTGFIILSAIFKLRTSKQVDIKELMYKYLDYRKKTQDYTHPSAGCIFKNPSRISAGFLIDACGLKGKRIGDAMISTRHANFIINLNKATAESVLKLIKIATSKVREVYGVELDPEIQIIG
jgi:UDP-N-acetylmuramate dehydrogenase